MNTSQLIVLLSEYKHIHPEDSDLCNKIFEAIEKNPQTYTSRKEFNDGHVCASAWVVNPDKTHVLLAHHKSLDKLMQFGGHVEAGDKSIYDSILREIKEETGLEPSLVQEEIFDVDIHIVPDRPAKNEPKHKHYDVRFLVEVPFTTPKPPEGESQDIAWYKVEEITPTLCEESVMRMARKMNDYL